MRSILSRITILLPALKSLSISWVMLKLYRLVAGTCWRHLSGFCQWGSGYHHCCCSWCQHFLINHIDSLWVALWCFSLRYGLCPVNGYTIFPVERANPQKKRSPNPFELLYLRNGVSYLSFSLLRKNEYYPGAFFPYAISHVTTSLCRYIVFVICD